MKKGFLKNIDKKKVLTNLSLALLMVILAADNSYAGEPKIVSGTVELAKAAIGWITVAVGVIAGAKFSYHGVGYIASDEEATKIDNSKKMKATVKGGALAITGPGLVTLVLSFYK